MSLDRTRLPATLYTAEQSRALDRTAIEGFGIPGFKLMQRAARAAFAVLLERWPGLRSVTLLCGGGNNGGDGFVMAGLARQKGIDVQLLYLGDAQFADKLQGEAREAWSWMIDTGVSPQPFCIGGTLGGEVVVDAMLGTGLGGDVRGLALDAIGQLNRSGRPVLAVDIPSGLCSDTGAVLGMAVRATCTVTFIGVKQGLLTHEAVDHVGDLYFDDLKLPDDVYESVPVSAFRTTADDLVELLPRRARASHKGSNGHVLVVGGDLGMGGAALMAAEAAARSGAGLVSLATRPEHVTAALVRTPEVMTHAVVSAAKLDPLIERASVIVVGPGLGQDAWGQQMSQRVLASDKPLVVDADGLNLVYHWGLADQRRENWIITPHPGEASRLLGLPITLLQSDRFAAVERLHRSCGGVAVLKGAGTLVSDGDGFYLCDRGNPGMASGGMGDVLSGIIAGLWAQGLSQVDAARLGVYLHATAADRVAARQGERGLMATDLVREIPAIANNQ